MNIVDKDYPHLVEFMGKCLFQDAAPTFEDAIKDWLLTGTDSVDRVVSDLDRLLSLNVSEPKLAAFTWRYCDYIHGDTARSTLEYIRAILANERRAKGTF